MIEGTGWCLANFCRRTSEQPVASMLNGGEVLIGTSGWSYRSWRGPFFPDDLPARSHLEYYARHFCTTELNRVFYRTPSEESVRGWAEKTPEDFVFAWKASKFITHWKRLNQTSVNSIALLESRLHLLGAKE